MAAVAELGLSNLGKQERRSLGSRPGRWEECCPLIEDSLPEMGLPVRVRVLKLHTLHLLAGSASGVMARILSLLGRDALSHWSEDSFGCVDMGSLSRPGAGIEEG